MSIKPWKGQIAEPENHNPVNKDAPDASYQIGWAYGYRGFDARNNIHHNDQGCLVYTTAAIGVIYDPNSHTQKYFGGGEVEDKAKNVSNDLNCHTDDIMCLAICGKGHVCLSGQNGSAPVAFLWDARSGQKLQRFKLPKGRRGVRACAVSCDGARSVVVDVHNDHYVTCYDNASGNMLWS